MNRNLDGSELTNEQLEALAVEALTRKGGAKAAAEVVAELRAVLHNKNLLRSALLEETMALRFEMMGKGLLKLSTRTERTSG